MPGLTYDTGALLAVEGRQPFMWSLHKEALTRGLSPTIPAGVLAQAWRGGPQANLSRLLAGCRIESMTEVVSRAIGAACAKSRTRDVVDASVIVGAIARRDVVVTSDPSDLRKIAAALGWDIELIVV